MCNFYQGTVYTGLVDIDSEFSWNGRNFVENEALSSNVKRIF